ncbi:hypothetical protein NLJ89_g925 [Agrocybe chaxingu]|uniref:DUF6534 domain-containing protein n=1 Tax=Agrocybe chaxingu TaxID=84603 RepID=A0A9W8N112_9AGAR|nr:hypothetical protein NLJ89_g925 [Agrocybe chaxingu]
MVYRIFCMSKNVMLYSGLILGSVGSFATGIASGVRIWILPSISTHTSLRTLIAWWLGIQAALDVVIAALLIALLQKQRTEDRGSRTNSVINRLIRGAGQTGLLPVLFAFSALVAFLVRPNSNLYIMFIIPIGRTYTTSFMDGLNGITSEIVWCNPTKGVMAVQVSIDQTHHQDVEAQKIDSLPDHVPTRHSKPSLDRPLPTVVVHPPSDA